MLFVKTLVRIGYRCGGLLSAQDYRRQKQNQEYTNP
jgi:hypothetical protein